MAKRPHENRNRWRYLVIQLLVVFAVCLVAYFCLSPLLQNSTSQAFLANVAYSSVDGGEGSGCCRGLDHTELWSEAVNWGNDCLLNSTQQCCEACKTHPKCNSWVYCADPAKCGANYRQCWLKRQENPLDPEVHDSASTNPWTSGLVFDRKDGILELAIDNDTTNGGVIRMELFPDCAPRSVFQILELAKLTHCTGCRFYRAEGRAKLWDANGRHISRMNTGPPYAVVQGTLDAQHVSFKGVPREYTPVIRRGMVGWVGEGPDFFISLADHPEWPCKHSVFATVVEADMPLVESLTSLPTTTTFWDSTASGPVPIEVLNTHIPLTLAARLTQQ